MSTGSEEDQGGRVSKVALITKLIEIYRKGDMRPRIFKCSSKFQCLLGASLVVIASVTSLAQAQDEFDKKIGCMSVILEATATDISFTNKLLDMDLGPEARELLVSNLRYQWVVGLDAAWIIEAGRTTADLNQTLTGERELQQLMQYCSLNTCHSAVNGFIRAASAVKHLVK